MSQAEIDVLAERQRQIHAEGFDEAHDEHYTRGELTDAAVCYIWNDNSTWPWDLKWWKPKNRRRDLVRAAALIIAEIDRIDRKASQ